MFATAALPFDTRWGLSDSIAAERLFCSLAWPSALQNITCISVGASKLRSRIADRSSFPKPRASKPVLVGRDAVSAYSLTAAIAEAALDFPILGSRYLLLSGTLTREDTVKPNRNGRRPVTDGCKSRIREQRVAEPEW